MRGRTLLIGTLLFALIVSVAPATSADAPPHVVITEPPAGSTVSGIVTIAGHAWDDVGVVIVKVHIDTGEWWNATDTSGNGTWWTWSTTWDTTHWANGWHHIGAIAKDSAGQLADTMIEVYVQNGGDNRPPWVAIDDPPNHSTVRGIVTVTGRAGDEDANDTVELVQVKIDAGEWQNATPTGDNGSFGHWAFEWNTSLVDDGWHAFAARAFDGTVWSDPKVFEYFVDNVQGENHAPFVKILHPETGTTVYGIVLVHGTASDPDDGDRVELVQIQIGGGEWHDAVDTSHDDSWSTWAYQWDTPTFDNGEWTVCARSFDGDLYSELSCRTVHVNNNHENQRPTVSITHPTNGAKVEGVALIHGRAADDVGVELVEVRFGDGEWHHATDTSPDDSWTTWAFEWDTTKRDDGCVYISARSWDGSLFSEVAKVYVCVDNHNDRPWAKITHPGNEETVHGLVLIHGTAGDDHGVKNVQVRIDEGEWHNAVNTGREHPWSTWAYEWDTTHVDNGKHRICARAWDGELYSEPHCITVIVDNDTGGGAGIFSQFAAPLGGGAPLVAFGLLSSLGVAILMWLRSHGYLRK